jgi:hypothetical protein
MNSKKLGILTLVTIAVIIAATLSSRHRAPSTSLQKQPLFPGMLEKVNDVHTIKITKQDSALTLVNKENRWEIQDADNYPADFGKIKQTVIAAAELKVVSEKTSNAELYERLGVEDPVGENSSSTLLSMLDGNEEELATMIVGKDQHSKSAGDKPGLYVRLPDSTTALLVAGQLDISVDVKDWFEHELIDINADRIKKIRITHPEDKEVLLGRESKSDAFTLDNLPEGFEIESDVVISRMETLLENISVDNVASESKIAGTEHIVAEVHTFDGLVITIASALIEGINYSSFNFAIKEIVEAVSKNEENGESAGSEASDPAEEANSFNQLVSGWAYVIPSFKFELFTRELAQLIKEIEDSDEDESEEN